MNKASFWRAQGRTPAERPRWLCPYAPRLPAGRGLLASLLLLAVASLAQAQTSAQRRVFILHSYALDFAWTRDVQRGMESVLDRHDAVETCVEFMDMKRRCGPADIERLRQLYKLKHGSTRFDAILCSDNDALAFLMAHGRDIFGDAPVVFCGVNDFNDSMIAGRSGVTGVIEEPDIAATLELALRLHPNARRAHVILDQTATGKAHEAHFRRVAARHAGRVEFVYITDATAAELRQTLSSAPLGGIIFYLSFWIDRDGKAHTTRDIVRLVSDSSRLPVYTCWQTFVECGFLGGRVISGHAQGQFAARMAVQILGGVPPASLPVVRESPNLYVFNGQTMRRFGLSASRLPAGSVMVRRSTSFYDRHARLIWSAGVFILGETGLVVVLLINRAKRRNAVRDLSGANRFLQTLLDTIPSPIFYRDARGLLAGCNHAFASQIAARPREDIIGQPLTQILAAAPASVVAAVLSASGDPRPEGQFTSEVAFSVPGGQTRHYLVGQATCRDAQGRPSGSVTVLADVTERRRAEEERRKLELRIQQTQKLESLGVLAGGIAHDFNNLLMGMLGYASVALADLSPVAPARHSVEQIERTAQRAADLVRQMLAYSGKGKLAIELLDLSELVEEMAHLLKVSVSKKAVLKLNLAKGLPAIEADATQIRQVIMNLITNASEAIGDKSGVISITTGAMRCDRAYLKESYLDEDLPDGCYIYVEVTDTGCGMTREVMARIFEPFYTSKFTGRGLGLAAVLGIVRGHRAAIKIYSEPGRGSSFKVLFPSADRAAQPAPPVPDAPNWKWKGEGAVLIVDDEETVRALAVRMFEPVGFKTITAADGREALDIFRDSGRQISLVLLDMTMPHLSGEETYREMRRIRPGVPVILSSGYNEQEATERFSGKGLAGFLHKPYRVADLLLKVREALER